MYGRLQFGKATSKGLMAFAFILGAGAYAVAASPLLERAPAEVSAADAWSPAALQAALDEGAQSLSTSPPLGASPASQQAGRT